MPSGAAVIVHVVWDLDHDRPAFDPDDPSQPDAALAVYLNRRTAEASFAWQPDPSRCELREMALGLAALGGHVLPRDTWPSAEVLAVCPGLTPEQTARRYREEHER